MVDTPEQLAEAAVDLAMPLVPADNGWLLRNAIRVRERQQALLDLGTVTYADLAKLTGVRNSTIRQRVDRARKKHQLVTVEVAGTTHVPVVFLDDGLDITDTWVEIIRALEADGMDPWLIWEWISLPNALVSDAIVADIIHTQPDRVVAALPRTANDDADDEADEVEGVIMIPTGGDVAAYTLRVIGDLTARLNIIDSSETRAIVGQKGRGMVKNPELVELGRGKKITVAADKVVTIDGNDYRFGHPRLSTEKHSVPIAAAPAAADDLAAAAEEP